MAFAPTRVKSFPRGSNYQTCGISECIADLQRERAMLQAHLSKLKVESPLDNHTAIISEKMQVEDKIDELSFTIGELQRELLASQRAAAQAQEEETQHVSLRRGNSMCETKDEVKNAQQVLEEALAAFEPFKICEEDQLQEDNHMDTSLSALKQNKITNNDVTTPGAEAPFNIHIMTSEQGKTQ